MSEQAPERFRLTVAGDAVGDLAGRLDRFVRVCPSRRGMRVSRRKTSFDLSVDPARIETVGPVIEAAAVAAGLRLVIDDLQAEVRSAGLDGWASGVWAAIGNAIDEDAVIRSRGESPTGDLFRYLRVEDVDGIRAVVDARAPLVPPVGGSAEDAGPQKFDDVDWHVGSAADAGQPREHAFTHIGIYLAWLIRHDLHDARWFHRDHIRAVKAGDMTGSDLADDVDWKLVSDAMTAEGAEFAAARYARYMAAYDAGLGDDRPYSLAEDAGLYEQLEPIVDGLYADWVAAGRPGPEPKVPSPSEAEVEAIFEIADIPWQDLAKETGGPIAIQLHPDGSFEVHRPERPHEDRELESLVPMDIVQPPIVMGSMSATHWGSSQLNRALKTLGVRARDATVAAGVGGRGSGTISVSVYRVPGASKARLLEAFSPAIGRPRRSSWSQRQIGDTTVSWAEGIEADEHTHVAYWTRDGLVFHVTGQPSDMEELIRIVG
jgi:hypothetical protein